MKGKTDMDNIRKLPEAEFDVMVTLWDCKESPVNTAYLMENVGKQKGWKAPTLISFLTRLEERGFIVIYPLRNADADPLMKFLMEFLALIIVLEFGAYLIGIFFIVYVVLSKIYSSRTKDYEIIRTLGVTKNDMIKIVNIELILIGMVVSILAYFAFYGVVLSVDVLSFLKYMNFGTFISYFFVMFMFSYFMAKRFNKRLFKFTVRKSMKGVHEDDQD